MLSNRATHHIWKIVHEEVLLFKNERQPLECSVKEGVVKNFANFTGIHLCWSLFNKDASLKDSNTETSTKVFSYEIWKIFKNTYFEEHLQTIALVRALPSEKYWTACGQLIESKNWINMTQEARNLCRTVWVRL